MKPAKFVLTVITILVVVSGILAFKSYRGIVTFYRPTFNQTGSCISAVLNFAPRATPTGTVYATTVPGAPCTIKAILITQP